MSTMVYSRKDFQVLQKSNPSGKSVTKCAD